MKNGVKLLLLMLIVSHFSDNLLGSPGLFLACLQGEVAVVATRLEADPHLMDVTNQQGRTLLHIASEGGQERVVKFLLGFPNSEALKKACQEGRIELVDQIVRGNKYVLDAYLQDTPLHIAAQHGHEKVAGYLYDQRPNWLEFKNKKGLTPPEVAR